MQETGRRRFSDAHENLLLAGEWKPAQDEEPVGFSKVAWSQSHSRSCAPSLGRGRPCRKDAENLFDSWLIFLERKASIKVR